MSGASTGQMVGPIPWRYEEPYCQLAHLVARHPFDAYVNCFHSAFHLQAQRQRKDRARRERLAASEAVRAQVNF